MNVAEKNIEAAGAFAAGLSNAGVRDVVMSPGSRSSPLILAFDAHPELDLHIVTDERSAAFFALGLARSSNRPVAVGCTSGTASANFLPAFIEASLSGIALVALTADRPAELRDAGAAQTIMQAGLFDGHAAWSTDAPPPSEVNEPADVFAALAARLVTEALRAGRGVHANLPFREPLWPDDAQARLDAAFETRPRTVTAALGTEVVGNAALDALASALGAHERGLIVAGPRSGDADTLQAALALSKTLGWPILADPLSGLRTLGARHPRVIDAYDALLRREDLVDALAADAVVRLGAVPTSKNLAKAIARWRPAVNVLFAPRSGWPDPDRTATDVVCGDTEAGLRGIVRRLEANDASTEWEERWIDASSRARSTIATGLRDTFIEGSAVSAAFDALADGDTLFLGNSMPVRDADAFCAATDRRIAVHCNRGANGIDGVVATAVGAHVRADGDTTLVIGDLSFVHDLGSLQLIAGSRSAMANVDGRTLTIVVVNNDGGGIFGFLNRPERGYERLFATPHGIELGPWVAASGAAYTKASNAGELADALGSHTGVPVRVIEVLFDREDNFTRRNTILDEAATAAAGALGGRTA